ncbi:MAG: DNA adenine methylase [Planctomycetaceae bacterium]
MRYVSPLRYPGGKTALAEFLTDTIDLNSLRDCEYYEPFAGGAGAALALLTDGVVSRLFLNDADVRVYAFWRAVLNCTNRFVKLMSVIPITVDEWKRQHAICLRPRQHSLFEVGFAAFYMNRCNRSGVLTGSGPIGGYGQTGNWRLDVRFNREKLSERILRLSRYRKNIHISCQDAIKFLRIALPRGRGRNRVFVYLDPPYVNKGKRLYLNAYQADDHRSLATYMDAQRTLPWLMSYDDSDLIQLLYKSYKIRALPIRYTLQEKREAYELIIAPENLAVPRSCRIGGTRRLLQEIA